MKIKEINLLIATIIIGILLTICNVKKYYKEKNAINNDKLHNK